MYQPGSHAQDFSSTFLLRCMPLFSSREGLNRSFPSSTVKSNFVCYRFNHSPLVGQLPGFELTSQRVKRLLRGYSLCRLCVCVFLCSHWSLVDVPLIFFCPADHVPDWQPRVLLGMVEARSVNVKKTTTTELPGRPTTKGSFFSKLFLNVAYVKGTVCGTCTNRLLL